MVTKHTAAAGQSPRASANADFTPIHTGCSTWGERVAGAATAICTRRPLLVLTLSLGLAGCQGASDRLSVEEWSALPPETDSSAEFAPAALAQGKRVDTFQISRNTRVIGGLRRVTAHAEDTLLDIARYFDIGYEEITRANPKVDAWLPHAGTSVTIPSLFILPDTPHTGLVLNLPALRLFYYPPAQKNRPQTVITYPIGIGREGWQTPVGTTSVVAKVQNPNWVVPPSIRAEHAKEGDPLPDIVRPGPDNPLGRFALRLGLPSYLIHGTNKPAGIGMRVSHGCIQLLPEDIAALFKRLPVGTPVRIVNQPYLAAWRDGKLYLEAHTPLEEDRQALAKNAKPLRQVLDRAVKSARLPGTPAVDWERVRQVVEDGHGVPVAVTGDGPGAYEALVKSAPEVMLPTVEPDKDKLPSHAWYVQAGSFKHESNARRLAAMIKHMGPSIPAHYVTAGEQHQVVAGPFSNRRQAASSAHRIKASFGTRPVVMPPGT